MLQFWSVIHWAWLQHCHLRRVAQRHRAREQCSTQRSIVARQRSSKALVDSKTATDKARSSFSERGGRSEWDRQGA